MKTIRQNADCNITIRRFDTGENVSFDLGTEIDLDDATAEYLLNYRTSGTNADGEFIEEAAQFVEV